MIRYSLVCAQGHAFESWFASSRAYDQQIERALVACPTCQSRKVEKAIMTPRVARADLQSERAAEPVSEPPPAQARSPVAMMSPQEREVRQKLKALRDHLIQNADHVGPRFPEEARKMHYGEIEHRSIYGDATPEEAKALHEEGIEFHPLPVLPEDRN
ncbi:MAG TPA: DUF1178 family protein [Xanthobacteraceae bacterium]